MTPEAPAASIGCARMDAHNEGEFSCDGVSVGDAYFHEDEVYASVIVTNDISGINGPIYCETGMVGSGAFVKASGTFTVSSDVAANGTIFVQNGYLSNAFQCRLEAAGPSNAIRMNLEPGNVFCGMIMNYDTTGCFVGNCFAKGQGAQVLQTAVALTTGRIYKFIIF